MRKLINRVLKLVGLNLVRAKRRKSLVKSAGIPYDASKYVGEYEWQNTPPHTSGYVAIGPNPVAIGPNPVAMGPTGNAGALGPPDGYEVRGPSGPGLKNAKEEDLYRVEQKAQQAFEKCCGLDSHPYRVDEIPRVEKPNSDNKTTS